MANHMVSAAIVGDDSIEHGCMRVGIQLEEKFFHRKIQVKRAKIVAKTTGWG
jgi:hypothetical protein